MASILAALCLLAAPAETRELSVLPLGEAGRYTGFELQSGGRSYRVLFGSLENLTAARLERVELGLRFSGLTATPTPRLADDSFVEVRLHPGSLFPEVRFRLHLLEFDQAAWRELAGDAPFHFLALSLEGAEIWHHRGWSIMTPVLDPFPMRLEGTGFAQQITSSWSPDWSYAPALAACPLPTTGLWRPAQRDYVGFDFHGARLTEHTERDIGTAYCQQIAGGGRSLAQFTCLVWPAARPHRTGRRYPELPAQAVCESTLRLIWSSDLPAWEDPNLLVQRFVWETYAEAMPTVPPAGDLSWLSEPYRLREFPGQGLPGGLLSRTAADDTGWWGPSSLLLGGMGWHGEPGLTAARAGNQAAVDRLQAAVREILPHGRTMTLGDEQVFCWQQPLEGGNVRVFGPGSETIHHVANWMAALAVMEAWRLAPADDLLPALDGLVRYSRQVLTTRNCYPDVAAAQFAWSCGPGVEFCYRYYYAFRDSDDAGRRELAQQAFDLAHRLVYRYLTVFSSDNDPFDELDSSFLFEPNAGINWLGAACANECWINLDTMARVYCHTGDPILAHYVYGALERWHVMYQDVEHPDVRSSGNSFTELYGLYEGGPIARGARGSYGGLWGGAEQTFWPVGGSIRVIAGEAAAMAFGSDGPELMVDRYWFDEGSCAVVLEGAAPDVRSDREFDVVVSLLNHDLTDRPTSLLRRESGGGPQPVEARRFANRPDSVLIRGVRTGDAVIIGTIDLGSAPKPCRIAKPRLPGQEQSWPAGFAAAPLAERLNRAYWFDYDDNDSMAGWEPGRKQLYGVPFELADPRANDGRLSVRDARVPWRVAGSHLFALVGEAGEAAALTVRFADGTSATADLDLAFPVLRGWPPCLGWQVDWVGLPLKGRTVVSLEPRGLSLFAATVVEGEVEPETLAVVEEKLEEQRQLERSARRFRELAPLFALCSGKIAVLPTGEVSAIRGHPVYRALSSEGLLEHVDLIELDEFVDPARFGPESHRLLLYFGHEKYIQTARAQGDVDAQIRRFLDGGGTMLVMSTGPFPFYYNEADRAVANAGLMGLSIRSAWEAPPPGDLTFVRRDGQRILTGVPARFAFPATGDLRYRPAGPAAAGAEYTPLLTLYDADGTDLGDGAAWQRLASGGQVGYVWSTLILDPTHRAEIATDLLRRALEAATPPVAEGAALRTEAPPVIDGRFDEPIWQRAQVLPLGHRFLSGWGAPAQATTVRCAWDDEHLYLAFEAQDTDIWSTITERDGNLWEGEVVEVYIDPDGDGRNYKEFEISPLGTVIDLDIATHLAIEPDRYRRWNAPGWRWAVALDGTLERGDVDRAWRVETAIPFADLGMPPPRPGDVWRVQFYRIDRPADTEPEFSGWSPTFNFHIPDRFGRLTFVSETAP